MIKNVLKVVGKKILLILLVSSLVISSSYVSFSLTTGNQVKATIVIPEDTPNWIQEVVVFFTQTGDLELPFKPYNWMTRGEFVRLAFKMYPTEVPEDLVRLEQQARKYNLILKEPFNPGEFISREEAVTLILRMANRRILVKMMKLSEADKLLSIFKDVDEIDVTTYKSLAVAVREGIIIGYPDKTLRPKATLTQAEVWALFYRIRGPITFLHFNDSHGRLEPFIPGTGLPAIGGFGRLLTLVNRERAVNPTQTFLFDLGDTIHGTNLVNLFKGKPAIEALNLFGMTAATLGNHEFNFGQGALRERIMEANYPFLLSNVVYETTRMPFANPYMILDVMGQKVGIFGLVTSDLPVVTHPDNVRGLLVLDPLETARRMVTLLREHRVNSIVALSHLGYSEDIKLAERVDGINLILGGHSHTVLEKPVLVRNTLIAQAGEHSRNLGRVDMAVRKNQIVYSSGKLIPTINEIVVDPTVTDLLRPYRDAVRAQMDRIIGSSFVLLDGGRPQIRTRETNLGNLVADVMRITTRSDIALQNGGGIRASIPAGPMKVDQVFTVLPFDNFLVVLELTGAQIKEALELSVSRSPAEFGGFLHVSGMSFVFDPKLPVNSRVTEITFAGRPLEMARTYRVATNDFLAVGGDGYAVFTRGRLAVHTGEFLRDSFIKYIEEVKIVSPVVEGRITVRP